MHRRSGHVVRAAVVAALAVTSVVGCGEEPHVSWVPPNQPFDPIDLLGGGQPVDVESLADDFIIVLRDRKAPSDDLLAEIHDLGATIRRRFDVIGVLIVSGLDDDAAQFIRDRDDVHDLEHDVVAQFRSPNERLRVRHIRETAPQGHTDPSQALYYADQWNLPQIGADLAWPATNQGQSALVCVVDTGIDPDGPEMVGRVDRIQSFAILPSSVPGPTWADDDGHGTLVASIIASNGVGTASIAPHARLCAVKSLDYRGVGTAGTLIAGVLYAGITKADVINVSASINDEPIPPYGLAAYAMSLAVDYARLRGAIVVAAAGNDGINMVQTSGVIAPAQLPWVIGVSAVGPTNQMNFDQRATYTNYGANITDFAAPGGESDTGNVLDEILGPCSIYSVNDDCSAGNVYVSSSGTSLAAPHVSGVAALVQGAIPKINFANSEIVPRGALITNCLNRGVVDLGPEGKDPEYGLGKIHAYNSVNRVSCGNVEGSAWR